MRPKAGNPHWVCRVFPSKQGVIASEGQHPFRKCGKMVQLCHSPQTALMRCGHHIFRAFPRLRAQAPHEKKRYYLAPVPPLG